MNARNRFLIRGVGALVLLWVVVFGIVKISASMKPTAAKILSYEEKNPLSEIEDNEKRKKVIGKMADMLNQMEAGEVALLAEREEDDPRRDFFRELTPDEQRFFFEKRVGRAFEQMMQSFNEMDREERKRVVERSLRQMRENGGGGGGPGGSMEEQDREMVEKIAEAGFNAYYSEASVETKIDLAPLMEEMQSAMSRVGGRRR
jgi:hypothetical protein